MTYRFTANIAYGWHEPGPDIYALAAGVGESEGEKSFALEFHCSFEEPDAHNIRKSCDSYCVVTPDQGTAYGCVHGVRGNDGPASAASIGSARRMRGRAMRPAGVVLDDGVQSMKIGDGIANVTARLTGMRATQDVQELSELIAPRQA